jgi:hypothetical protein
MKRLALMISLAAVVAGISLGASAVATPSTPEPARATIAAVPAPERAPEPAKPTPEQLEEARAQAIVDDLATTYRYLDGVTVAVRPTPKDHEAIAYYTDGEIVISPEHTVALGTILAHEIWHVIDWRDNGRLDWGENLPPSDTSDYLL